LGISLESKPEPVVGHLTIRAKQGLKFYRRDGDIQMETKIAVAYENGHYRIELDRDLVTYWPLMK
jgi:hypothetical protein